MLRNNEEIVGILLNVIWMNGECILQFSHTTEIHIPSDSFDKELLESSIGKDIGILNLDGTYHIRFLGKKTNQNDKEVLADGN